MTPLTIHNNEQNMQFELFLDDDRAFLEYRFQEGIIILMHTEVPEKLGGKGIASALAAHAFNYAREHHLRVKLYCPFVLTWVKKHTEQMDIVIPPPEGRGQL
jgi:predicted GNAT family acetyltransferase